MNFTPDVICDYIRYFIRDDDKLGIPDDLDEKIYEKVMRLIFPKAPFDAVNITPGCDGLKGEYIEMHNMLPEKYNSGYLLACVWGSASVAGYDELCDTLKRFLKDNNEELMPKITYPDLKME